MKLPELPPLPDPRFDSFRRGGLLIDDGWDADQMHAYATTYAEAAVKTERERLMDGAMDALQSDTENGVKWLNSAASFKFKAAYPALSAWLAKENT